MVSGTVLPPRELGRVGELQVFPGDVKKQNKQNDPINGIHHNSKLGPYYYRG